MYFSLKNPKGKESLIVLRYFVSKSEGRFVYSTGLKINPEDWDKNTKMAKASRGRTDLSSINRGLQKFSTFLEKTLTNFELNNIEITRQILKDRFFKEFKPDLNNSLKFTYLTEFIDDFIKKAPLLTNRVTNRKYSTVNIEGYQTTKKRLIKFEEYNNKIRIDDFTIGHYDNLIDFLKIKGGYSVNSIGATIKNIKMFLKKAEEFGYTTHKDYKDSRFKVLKEVSKSIVLNEREIEDIFNYDFSSKPYLENCRDLAIIGLWTGLRVSDLLALPEIDTKEDYIIVQPKKTRNSSSIKVVIPLHHHIKEVINSRGMPRKISDVKFNKYFKEVCKYVGINNMVEGYKICKSGDEYRKKEGMYPKHELVSSHTCRRSFATNLYKMNFPTLSIMSITGHTTEKNFLAYIKVTPKEHAEKLMQHWKEYYIDKPY